MIPQSLTALPRWINYRIVPASPKPRKQPLAAAWQEPAAWMSYTDAATKGPAGFVLTADDGLVIVDFDGCVTDGQIADDVWQRVLALNSYAEWSVSGKGIHVIVRATLPFSGRNWRNGIEAYADRRWFLITGNHIDGTPDDILPSQPAIDALVASMDAAKQAPPRPVAQPGQPAGKGYAKAALRHEAYAVATAANGCRNDRLNRAAFSLGQLVGSGALDERDVVDALTGAARDAGLDDSEIGPTIRSGIAKGVTQPRTVPARDPQQRQLPPAPDGAPEVPGIYDAKGKPAPLLVAELIRHGRHIVTLHEDFYEYDGGVYRRVEPWVYEREVTHALATGSRKAFIADALKHLQILTAVHSEAIRNVGGVMNVANGLLDVAAGTLGPHTPDHLSTVQIPIEYDAAAGCPAWLAALDQWFPGQPDVVALLQEYYGYCLTPDVSQHKALVMLGEGANGKSVACHVLKRLVGQQNVAAVGLAALSKAFSVAELDGKLVNISVEVEVREGIDEGVFKQLVAGDPVMAERKYQNPYLMHPFARFVIATNNLWHIDDRSDGMYRRLLLVRFGRAIPAHLQDRDLTRRLDAELPGILNWALAGLHRLKARGSFVVPASVEAEVEDYRRSNNPVATWLEECTVTAPACFERTADLYRSYREWCSSNGHRAMAVNKFGTEIKRAGLDIIREFRDGRQDRGCKGIRLGG